MVVTLKQSLLCCHTDVACNIILAVMVGTVNMVIVAMYRGGWQLLAMSKVHCVLVFSSLEVAAGLSALALIQYCAHWTRNAACPVNSQCHYIGSPALLHGPCSPVSPDHILHFHGITLLCKETSMQWCICNVFERITVVIQLCKLMVPSCIYAVYWNNIPYMWPGMTKGTTPRTIVDFRFFDFMQSLDYVE